jgi:hypothetical protein
MYPRSVGIRIVFILQDSDPVECHTKNHCRESNQVADFFAKFSKESRPRRKFKFFNQNE